MAHLHTINLTAGWTRVGEAHARRFQWPRPLPVGESLWLVLTTTSAATLTLNGVPLAALPAAGDHALQLLAVQARNELVVETTGQVPAARLEVRGEANNAGCRDVLK